MNASKPVVALVGIVGGLIAGWSLGSFKIRAETAWYYRGLCDSGVGTPYIAFVHTLRELHEAGRTDELGAALAFAYEHSFDICRVWREKEEAGYRAIVEKAVRPVAQPVGPGNGSQPLPPDPDRAPSAAGSRP